jgi:S-formylglutathione hydrolase FrmB
MNKTWFWALAWVACSAPESSEPKTVEAPAGLLTHDTSFVLSTDQGAEVRFDYYAAPAAGIDTVGDKLAAAAQAGAGSAVVSAQAADPVLAASHKLIIALPGWNHSASQYVEHSSLIRMARARGYAVLLVHMGKSVYADSVYPETRSDYRLYPTSTWFSEQVWYELEHKLGLFPNCFVGLVGYSTGARGAITLAMQRPEWVSAVAAWSGDYLPSLDYNDALLVNALGPHSAFPERWDRADLCAQALGVKCPVYLSHTYADEVVPMAHSQALFAALDSSQVECNWVQDAGIKTVFLIKGGHNWDYWASQVLPSLNFFDRVYEKGIFGQVEK